MNVAPKELDPSRQMFGEALGQIEGRGRLQGRRVIVVGAGQRVVDDPDPPVGNGRAASLLFAREGASVGCIDLVRPSVEETQRQVEQAGGTAYAEVGDVSDPEAIPRMLSRCVAQLGGLDGLVLNVGISKALQLRGIERFGGHVGTLEEIRAFCLKIYLAVWL
ncbi:MAG: SDR family oxidoreductase [Oxalobacteraceae bacterium]|nr:MAG: SDR family oxidoreductase [Oxalobacteraceae bacterium]